MRDSVDQWISEIDAFNPGDNPLVDPVDPVLEDLDNAKALAKKGAVGAITPSERGRRHDADRSRERERMGRQMQEERRQEEAFAAGLSQQQREVEQ